MMYRFYFVSILFFILICIGFVSKINLSRKNLVFYSLPADKGFKAYVDEQETKIYKVNLGLSGILVPQGVHKVKSRTS